MELANDKFGRIGVLMGGPSCEREISLKSGKAVYEALRQLSLDVTAIDIKTDDAKENMRLIESQRIDCAFVALHGSFGEDGQIQELLEGLKIPYTGSGVTASKLAMDKIASRRIFESKGLNVPNYTTIDKISYNKNWKMDKKFGLPLVIKPATQGSSIGLSIIQKEESIQGALYLAFQFDDRVIIEDYISGREITVGILDGVALPVIEIIPKKFFFDYEAKYQPGLTEYVVPAKLDERIREEAKATALSAHKLLGCIGCSRVDMILDKQNRIFVLELNSIPGLTGTSLLPKAAKQAGIEFPELVLRLVRSAYEKTKIQYTS